VGGHAIAILRMSDEGPLSHGRRIQLQSDFAVVAVEPLVGPFGHKTGQGCQTLSAAERLDIAVQNRVSGWGRSDPPGDFDFVRIFRLRRAGPLQQTRNDLWRRAAAMARVAS